MFELKFHIVLFGSKEPTAGSRESFEIGNPFDEIPIFVDMKAAALKEIKEELKHKSKDEILDLCLSMVKFKKENKELITYLLFEANNEDDYIKEIKHEITLQFQQLNINSYYFAKKGVRKVLRNAKKFIRYSKKPQTEVEVLLHYCEELKSLSDFFVSNTTLIGIYDKQLAAIKKKVSTLHEDLQYDYNLMIEEMEA